MGVRRSSRLRQGTIAIVVLAMAAVAAVIAVTVRLDGAAAPQLIAPAAAVSQAPPSTVCSASGPGGTWTISSTGIATLATAGTGPAVPCTTLSLPGAGQASAVQQCVSTLQAAQQQIQQEAASVLFQEFMTNLIQNNASRWASALTSQGYQGPAVPATSQQVSNAINQVSATNTDLANAVSQALASLLNHSFDTPVDCSAAGDPVSGWYSNAFQALADDDTEANLVNQALNAVASQIAQLASAFTVPAPAGAGAAPPGGPTAPVPSGACEGNSYSMGTKGNHKIVIGEDQVGRVIPAANALGASYLDLTNAPETDWLTINMQWLNDCMDEGFTIYDIGPSSNPGNYPDPDSAYYYDELKQIRDRNYPTTPYSQPSVPWVTPSA